MVRALWDSPHRFNVVPAGRRSLKTETRKRKVVIRALRGNAEGNARFFLAAPTRDQAKRIFWDDIKSMVPDWAKSGKPSETELLLHLRNGSMIAVMGMDKPERIEGSPWDGGVLDEFANMKSQTWGAHVRPALSDRLGWCDLIGVPEGRNHYYDVAERARAGMLALGDGSEWGLFTWPASDVLPAEEIEAARQDLDELTFQQEYEASFVNFVGQAYYPFSADNKRKLEYDKKQPIAFCFDFNVAPGVAAICQEFEFGTGVIGEVWIPRNSNTPAVCKRLVQDWGEHEGRIGVYGDATGGARGSAKVAGSDWDLVRQELTPHFSNLWWDVPDANPAERSRVNAVNTRIKAGDGTRRLFVDPSKVPHVVRDLEGVRVLEGGSGEIDKRSDKQLTHISDALGYYIVKKFPITPVRRPVVRTLRI